MDKEIWREVLNYDGNYVISNLGRVKRTFDRDGNFIDRHLKLHTDENGYINVVLCKNSVCRRHRMHRLLMIAFKYIPNYIEMDVRHIDGNPSNNDLNNLSWGTHAENMQDKKVHGTVPCFQGSKNPAAILNEAKVLEIRKKLMTGDSMKNLANEYGVSEYAIWDIAKYRSWLNVKL